MSSVKHTKSISRVVLNLSLKATFERKIRQTASKSFTPLTQNKFL